MELVISLNMHYRVSDLSTNCCLCDVTDTLVAEPESQDR
jgi:hypothetical protein